MLLTIYLNCLQMRNSWLQTWIKRLTSTAAGWFVGSIHRPNLSPYAESLYIQYIDAKSWLEWINNGLCVRVRAVSLFAQLGAGRGLVALTVPELCEGHGDFSPSADTHLWQARHQTDLDHDTTGHSIKSHTVANRSHCSGLCPLSLTISFIIHWERFTKIQLSMLKRNLHDCLSYITLSLSLRAFLCHYLFFL